MGILALLFCLSNLHCAGNVKIYQVRVLEQKRFLKVHGDLNDEMDSLNVLYEDSDLDTCEGYQPLLAKTLVVADTLAGHSYYRFQVQQILETGYGVLYNHWGCIYNAAARKSNQLLTQRTEICSAARERDYRRALNLYADLEASVANIKEALGGITGPSAWAELDRRSLASNRLPNPTEAPVVDLSGAKENLLDLWKRSNDLQVSVDELIRNAADSMQICARQELTWEYNRLIRDLNAGATKDGAGYHGEAMGFFVGVQRKALELHSLLSSDLSRTMGLLGDREDHDSFKEQVLRLAETAERNRRTAEYNYAMDLYESLASQFRKGESDPSLIVKEIDYLLSLSGVEGELEDRLGRLRRSILEPTGNN
jgi:hypothetical protein